MRDFLIKYRALLFGIIPVYIWICPFVPFMAYPIAICFILMMRSLRRDDLIIIHYLVILVLADLRGYDYAVFKSIRIVCILLFSAFTIADIFYRKYKFNKNFLIFIPFFIIAFISAIKASPILPVSLQRTLAYMLVLFVVYHYFLFHFRKSNYQLVSDLVYFSGVLFLLGILEAMLGISSVWTFERFNGIFGNPNGIGLFCMLMITFYIIYINGNASYLNVHRSKIFIFIGLAVVSLILSNSRNALMSILIFLFLYWVFSSKPYIKLMFWFVFIPGVVLFFLNFSILDIIYALGLDEILRAESIVDGSGRTISWTFALFHIPKRPWLGGGFYFDQYLYQNHVPEVMKVFRFMASTWNTYLTFLLNTGIIGTLLFFGAILGNLRTSLRKSISSAYIMAMLFSAIYETWFSASLNTYTIYFFLTLIILQEKRLWS